MARHPVLDPGDTRLEADAADLQQALSDLVRVYQFRDRKRGCYYDLSVTQCYTLEAVIRLESPRVDDVAAALYLEKSTASRVVEALVRMEYVVRRPDPKDGRVVRVRATQKGRRLHRRIEEDLLAQTRDLLASFDSRTRRDAARVLAELAASARRRFLQDTGCAPEPAKETDV